MMPSTTGARLERPGKSRSLAASRAPRWALSLGLALGSSFSSSACLAPRDSETTNEGSLDELSELMRSVGAEPVQGTEVEGPSEGLEGDGEAFADPEEVTYEPSFEPLTESPYIRFGERIIVRELDDGTTQVTKPYTLPATRAARVVELLGALEPFPFRERPPVDSATGELPPLDTGMLEYQILAGFDEEFYTDLRYEATPDSAKKVTLSDVLVVTAAAELLAEFEDFLDLFAAAGVPQIELEAKIIEIVETDTTDIGVRSPDGTPVFEFGTANFVKALDFSLPNLSSAEALLTLGAVQDGVAFNAIIEAVKSWENVTIESRPKTVVRAGGVARIDTAVEIPFIEFKTLAPDGTFTTATQYKRVGVQLSISPRRVGTSTLALDVHLEGSQQVGSQATLGVSGGGLIEVPIIAYRTAKTLVYLEPGQTLVIGGLTQEREVETVRKVPILGDVPLLGFFFRSTFEEVERQHVLFAISPRIIQRSDFESDF